METKAAIIAHVEPLSREGLLDRRQIHLAQHRHHKAIAREVTTWLQTTGLSEEISLCGEPTVACLLFFTGQPRHAEKLKEAPGIVNAFFRHGVPVAFLNESNEEE